MAAGQLNEKYKKGYWTVFKRQCHELVVRGYFELLKSELNYREWEEEDISAALYLEMDEIQEGEFQNITIVPEFRIYDDEIRHGLKKAKRADRIDFRFSSWNLKKDLRYFGEAKNLSEKTWNKETNKARVDASNYRSRYLKTGIERIVSGKYSALPCFLVGYIVNGSANQNFENLNKHIQKRRVTDDIGLLEVHHPIWNYDYCYISKNLRNKKQINLPHIFLEFDT